MTGAEIADRLAVRIADVGLTENSASLKAGLDRGYIGQIRRQSPERSPSVDNIVALCRVLGLRIGWVIEGQGPMLTEDEDRVDTTDPNLITVDRDLLKQAIRFALKNEGVLEKRAALVADILPAALSGLRFDTIDRDPFLSFRLHFELEEKRSERPAHL